jgi:hypothetical protein
VRGKVEVSHPWNAATEWIGESAAAPGCWSHGRPSRCLLLCAKDLIVAARVGLGATPPR